MFSKTPASNKEGGKSIIEQFAALRKLPEFFSLIWQTSKSLTTANVILRIIKAAIPLVMLFVGKLIIDEVILQIGESEKQIERLLWLIGIELGLAVFSDLLNRSLILLDSLLGDLFSNKTSIALMKHASMLDLEYFEDAEFYDKLDRARRQTISRVVLLSQILTQFQEIITIAFLAVALVAFNYWLLVILLIAVIPSFIGETHFNERSYSMSRGWTPERRELDYLRFIGASDETAKEVKVFGLSNFITQRFDKLAWKYYYANRKLATSRASWGALLSAIGTLAYYGAYVFIIYRTINGLITVGDLTFLAGSFQRTRSMLQSIMTRFSQITEGALYLQDLFDFMKMSPKIVSRPDAISVPPKFNEGFIFENVGYRYINGKDFALRGLNFRLKAGEKLALVGENGAGKTTLIKLLSRLYDPTEGTIWLDGQDLRTYNLEQLRNAVGVIFQDYMKFQMRVFENIAIGQIDQIANQAKISAAAEKSLANEVIEKLNDGYDQMLGKRFEGGVELSGGEWQKIALARAYMRDAQLLVLDEPTSALDARAEHEVFTRFAELIEGKTAILISHRFSTVRMADRILLLQNGRVGEIGTHEELLANGKKYAELFNLQASGYH